jgi:hypothetical protein
MLLASRELDDVDDNDEWVVVMKPSDRVRKGMMMRW